jgi:hypothetical protein
MGMFARMWEVVDEPLEVKSTELLTETQALMTACGNVLLDAVADRRTDKEKVLRDTVKALDRLRRAKENAIMLASRYTM